MKKLIFGSLILLTMSLSITVFQISCTKDASAQTGNNGITQKNTLVYSKLKSTGLVNGQYGNYDYYTCSYDGSNKIKIPIQIPSNVIGICPYPKVSPDGQTLFFTGITGITSGICYLYSCNINGSNLKVLSQEPQSNPGGGQIEISNAF